MIIDLRQSRHLDNSVHRILNRLADNLYAYDLHFNRREQKGVALNMKYSQTCD